MISGASDEELDIAIARADVLLELQPKIDELKKENQQLKEQLKQKEDIINKAKKYIKNNSHKTEWGDLEQDNESIDINDDVTDTEFITDLLEILDNKGE